MSTINQHEAKQSQENFLYNSIVEKIKNSDIDKTFKNIETNNFKINTKQYEILGNIAYMFGIEFVGQQKHLKKVVMENFVLRMKSLNLSSEQLFKFSNILKNISIENIENSKDKLKELIVKECEFSGEITPKIKSNINSIFRNSNFSVSYIMDIDELMKVKKITYGQLLKANKIIYENINISGKSFKNLRVLLQEPEYIKEINKASEYFDSQKFSLVYFDMILSLKEWFELSDSKLIVDGGVDLTGYSLSMVDKPELLEEFVDYTETENVIENIEVNEPEVLNDTVKIEQNNPDDTDLFLIGVIKETLNSAEIPTAEVLLDGFNQILNSEDLVQHVYSFVKAGIHKNRKLFTECLPFEKSEFTNLLDLQLNKAKASYKTLVENYVKEINPDNLPKIVNYVNDLINSLVIDNSEKKSYLFQQLNENQIFTIKQLHQTIGLIEDCNINGSEINSYINLRDYLTNNLDIKEIFESIADIDNRQLEINFLTGISEFYSDESYRISDDLIEEKFNQENNN